MSEKTSEIINLDTEESSSSSFEFTHTHPEHDLQTDNVGQNYKKKYGNLLKSLRKETERIKQKAARDILEKLSKSHEEHIKSQEDTYEELIRQITITHLAKIKATDKYYDDQLKEAHKREKKLHFQSNQLIEENKILTSKIHFYEVKLNNIENLLLGRPPTSDTNVSSAIFNIKREGDGHNHTEDRDNEIKKLNTELQNMKNKEAERNSKLFNELKRKEEEHKKEITQKENYIDQLLAQIKYQKDVIAEHEIRRKEKEIEICELQKHLECSVVRHNEQFRHYEKLVLKARSEIELHKREIARLQEHIASVNFTASPAVRTKQILESTSSSKKTPRQTPKMTPLKWCEEDCVKYDVPNVNSEIATNNETDSKETKSVARCLEDKFQLISIKEDTEDKKSGVSLTLTNSDLPNPLRKQESVKSTDGSTKGSQKPARKRGRPRKNPCSK